MKMWAVLIRDQTACLLQSDLYINCPQKLRVSSVRKKFNYFVYYFLAECSALDCELHLTILRKQCGRRRNVLTLSQMTILDS